MGDVVSEVKTPGLLAEAPLPDWLAHDEFQLLTAAPDAGDALVWTGERLELRAFGRGAPGPVAVDWASARMAWRQKTMGRKQPLARAVGFKPGFLPTIVDATAGLGQDSFILASLGATVFAIERAPVAYALLQDGLRRAAAVPELADILGRMTLLRGEAYEQLGHWGHPRPDVVYLDPMYPETGRTALSGKGMQAFQRVIGGDWDADRLLAAAQALASRRVVVKRPKKAGFLGGVTPMSQILGESTRYDLYAALHPAD